MLFSTRICLKQALMLHIIFLQLNEGYGLNNGAIDRIAARKAYRYGR